MRPERSPSLDFTNVMLGAASTLANPNVPGQTVDLKVSLVGAVDIPVVAVETIAITEVTARTICAPTATSLLGRTARRATSSRLYLIMVSSYDGCVLHLDGPS